MYRSLLLLCLVCLSLQHRRKYDNFPNCDENGCICGGRYHYSCHNVHELRERIHGDRVIDLVLIDVVRDPHERQEDASQLKDLYKLY